MSDALITKYRPREFKDVIGQDAVVKSLVGALEKRVADAFLFAGPSGTGKTTLARLAAAKLGCKPADLVEVDAASKTGIDDMRGVTADLMYMPIGEGAIKAIIIDECQALSKQAFQSLLKILEEPPPWVFWFLCTTEPTRVPKNIETRCLRYELKPVGSRELTLLLDGVEEGAKLPGDIIELCAREAAGSPRQALSNLAACLTAKNKAEAADLLRSASESKQAIDLARLLNEGGSWGQAQQLLNELAEVSPESVRHVVRSYMTKVILGAKNEKGAANAMAVLEAFSAPFPSSDGLSPLVLACGKLMLG
jgi:DNA polymerase-3 subunit gamma/tau